MQRVMKYATLLTFHLHAAGGGVAEFAWREVLPPAFRCAKFMRELRQMLQLTSTVQKLANI